MLSHGESRCWLLRHKRRKGFIFQLKQEVLAVSAATVVSLLLLWAWLCYCMLIIIIIIFIAKLTVMHQVNCQTQRRSCTVESASSLHLMSYCDNGTKTCGCICEERQKQRNCAAASSYSSFLCTKYWNQSVTGHWLNCRSKSPAND